MKIITNSSLALIVTLFVTYAVSGQESIKHSFSDVKPVKVEQASAQDQALKLPTTGQPKKLQINDAKPVTHPATEIAGANSKAFTPVVNQKPTVPDSEIQNELRNPIGINPNSVLRQTNNQRVGEVVPELRQPTRVAQAPMKQGKIVGTLKPTGPAQTAPPTSSRRPNDAPPFKLPMVTQPKSPAGNPTQLVVPPANLAPQNSAPAVNPSQPQKTFQPVPNNLPKTNSSSIPQASTKAPVASPMPTANGSPSVAPFDEPEKTTVAARSTNESGSFADRMIEDIDATAQSPSGTSLVPIVSLEIKGPSSVNQNQVGTYNLKLRNIGDVDAKMIDLMIQLPENMEFVRSDKISEQVSSTKHSFQLGRLLAGHQSEVLLQVRGLKKGPVNIGTRLIVSADAAMALEVTKPEMVMDFLPPPRIRTNDPTSVKIQLTNRGNGVAEDVKLKGLLPEILSSTNGGEIETSIGSIAPGETKEVHVILEAQKEGKCKLTFSAETGAQMLAEKSREFMVVDPRLVAEIQGPELVYLQRDAVYIVTVSNPGEINASDVDVALKIPDGLRVDSIDRHADFNADTNTLTWKFSSLLSGQSEQMKLKAIATKDGMQIQKIKIQSSNGHKAKIEHLTQVVSRADLRVIVEDSGVPVKIGETVEFRINAMNRGAKHADDVRVAVNFPAGVVPVDSDDYKIEGGMVVFSAMKLPAGKVKKLTVKAVCSVAGDQIIQASIRLGQQSRSVRSEESVFVYDPAQSSTRTATQPESNIRR